MALQLTVVLQAISRPILHHRSPEFEALFGRVLAGLAELIGTRSEVIVLAERVVGRLGVPVELGSAVRAAQRIFAEEG